MKKYYEEWGLTDVTTFRNEVFELAKYLSGTQCAKNIKSIRKEINDLSDPKIFNTKQLLFSGTIEERTHFYGLLLLNNQIELGTIKDLVFKNSETFSYVEKKAFFEGNQILIDVFNSLRKSLDFLPMACQLSLSPYANLKKINDDLFLKGDRVVEQEEFSLLSESFKKMSLVKKIEKRYSNIKHYVNTLTIEDILSVYANFENEIRKYGFSGVPPEMERLSSGRDRMEFSEKDQFLDFLYLLYCLKESIHIALTTFYTALIGRNLGKIDENNIIDIITDFGNAVRKGRVYSLIHGNFETAPLVGNIVLMDYEIKKINEKVHDFGIVNSRRSSTSQEEGSRVECSIILIDECLNRYYPFVKN